MKVKGLLCVALISIAFGGIPNTAAAASDISATFLEVPATKPTLKGGQAPFIVEFNGGLAQSASNCGEFGADAKITIRWVTSQASLTDGFSQSVPGLRSYEEGTFYKTLGATPTGIKCELSHVSGWYNGDLYNEVSGQPGPLYKFNKEEESAPLALVALSDGREIGRGNGLLSNPDYFPYDASIFGLDRGQMVGQKFQFSISGRLPDPSKISSESIVLNGVSCSGDFGAGGACVYRREGKTYTVLTNLGDNTDSPPGNIVIYMVWDVKNSMGLIHTLTTPPVSISWNPTGSRTSFYDLSDSGLFLTTTTECSNSSTRPGATLSCKTFPELSETPDDGQTVNFRVVSELNVEYKADSGKWKNLKTIHAGLGKYSNFTVRAPKFKSYLAIRTTNQKFAKIGDLNATSYGTVPGVLYNNFVLPKQIFWGKKFKLSASPEGGKATSCTFYDSDKRTVIGKGTIKNGRAVAYGRKFWTATIGSGTELIFYSRCSFGKTSNWEYASTTGLR